MAMEITQNIITNISENYTFIANVSIGVFIGISVTFITYKIVSKAIPVTFKYLVKKVLEHFYPISFISFILNNQDNVEGSSFNASYQLNMPNGKHNNAKPGAHLVLKPSIQPRVNLPYSISQYLYPNKKCTVFLVDEHGLLNSWSKTPGAPQRYELATFEYESNVISHLRLEINPREYFDFQLFPIWVYYMGKKYTTSIILGFPEITEDNKEKA